MPGMRATRVSSTYQVGQALLRNWRCLGCRFPGEKQLFDYETRIRLQRKWVNQVLSSLAGRRYSKHRQSNSGFRVSLTACLLKSRRRSQRRCESGNKVVIHAATCDLAAPQSAIPCSSASSPASKQVLHSFVNAVSFSRHHLFHLYKATDASSQRLSHPDEAAQRSSYVYRAYHMSFEHHVVGSVCTSVFTVTKCW